MAREMRNGGRQRIKREQREDREREKRELRRQFEEVEGLKEILTWTSNTRKSQLHFKMKLLI